jgi:GTP diphosphokinase / guanosine-3',5'-bis(diphosphate) 3'-diphosphatase
MSNQPEHIAGFRSKYDHLIRLIRRNKEINDYSRLRKAYDMLTDTYGREGDPVGHRHVYAAIEIAEIAVNEIGLGITSVVSIFLIRAFNEGKIGLPDIEKEPD